MHRAGALALVAALGLAPVSAQAEPLASSPRPQPNPHVTEPTPPAAAGASLFPQTPPQTAPQAFPAHSPLPRPRPDAPVSAPPQSVPEQPAGPLPAEPSTEGAAGATMPGSLFRPEPRPRPRPALPAQPTPSATPPVTPRHDAAATAQARGALCGTRGIEGEPIAPIPAKVQGCGLADGVKVVAISGIPFSQPLTVDCPTAQAMKVWIDRGIVPAVGRKGGGIARIEILATYTCRPRNNQRGAKISEHGRGHAIDFGGVTLRNGKVIDVLTGWRSEARMLRAIHAAACGPFGTVLGPKADRFHLNHIHVDTARYRSGPYCR